MALRDEILTLKNKEGTLANNKVCNFAYDDTAFEDDTTTGANGVITYNYNNHNNIPVKDSEVLKTNTTIISKGFRSQVSTLPRMLLNHIFGRVSYNLNKTVDTFNSLLSNLYNYIGQPNGLATLDNTGRLPYSQLPLSAVEYKGAWNARTNTPTLASGTGTFGDEYIVRTQGTQNLGEGSITYRVGDRVIYNGSIWQRIPASSVRTVNSKTPDANGNVTVNASDIVTPDVYGYDRTNMGKVWEGRSNYHVPFGHVVKGNNIWVACVANTGTATGVYWSVDGKNWTKSTSSGIRDISSFSCLYYANGLFIASKELDIDAQSPIYWSVDGKNWTQGTLPSGAKVYITCVTFANGIWVAGTHRNISTYTSYGAFWSVDGKTWNPALSGGTFDSYSICYANGLFVIGGGADMFWSDDGKNWTVGTGNTRTQVDCIAYGNSLWVNENGDWSDDGKAWNVNHSVKDYFSFNYLAYHNGLWVGVVTGSYGSYYRGIYWSENGKNWTRGESSHGFGFVIYAGSIWLACSENGANSTAYGMYYSVDGKTWTPVTDEVYTNPYYLDIAFDNIMIVAVGKSGNVHSFGSNTNNVEEILDWLLYAVDNVI